MQTNSAESVESECEEEQLDQERLVQLEETCRDPDMAIFDDHCTILCRMLVATL